MNEFRDLGGGALPESMRALPWGAPESFLGLPADEARFRDAPIAILPVPYETTVSYMGGTRFGPRAILHASRYVELYDHELDFEPYRVGMSTLPELMLSGAGPEVALGELRAAYDALLDEGKFVILLGGEHSVSGPPILAHADRATRGLTVLQFDAHSDLRSEYEGTPYSHASVMYRVHERVRLAPVGIRSLTAQERRLMRERGIDPVFGHELGRDGWIDRVLGALGPDVYITFDVDYFDPGIMPSTGTPEPGGGTWYPTLQLLEAVFRERRVVGCDVVELGPIPGLVAPDFTAAKLVYKMVAYWARYQQEREPAR
jgi:agmatinase